MIVRRPIHNTIHLVYEDQRTVCGAMMRMQEFYESPHPEFKGKILPWDETRDVYMGKVGSDYLTDWNGFNVPGHVVAAFFDLLRARRTPPTDPEMRIAMAISDANLWHFDFYLIATWKDEDVDHELAHAMFHLDRHYRHRTTSAVGALEEHMPSAMRSLRRWLLDGGYSDAVMTDEMQAYLATSPIGYLVEKIGPNVGRTLHEMGEGLRLAFERAKVHNASP